MAFHYRKLSRDETNSDDVSKNYQPCFFCYRCPDNCSDYLSPPPSVIPPSPSSPRHHFSIFLILMLSLLGASFIFVSYLTIRRYRTRNWTRRRNNPNFLNLESGNFREDFLEGRLVDHPIWYIRTVGLPQSVIDSIAEFTYKKDEGLIEGRDCAVCLSEFEEDERLRLLPKCSHAFHLPCIDTWLGSHQNCPVCRAPVLFTSSCAVVPQVNSGTGLNGSGSGEVNEVVDEPVPEPELEIDETRRVSLIENDDKVAEMLCSFDERTGAFRVMSDLADRRVRIDRELQEIRRSVSMDFDPGSRVYRNLGKENLDVVEKRGSVSLYGLMKSSSRGKSSVLQIKGPVSMKKSVSFGRKRSFRGPSRSLDSVLVSDLRLQIN